MPVSQIFPRHWKMALLVSVLLFLIYLLTFSATVKSDDELFLIDTTDSLVIRKSLLLNETVYLRGLQTTDVEPAQPILAAPLYWLAYQIPWIGNVHAIYLFNPIVVALTASLLFFYALHLGYEGRTALIATFLFGLTTIVWPYTKTFFREPLTTFNLFLAAFCIEHWRNTFTNGDRNQWWWLAAAIAAIIVAFLSKEAVLIALPVLIALAYPGIEPLKKHRRTITIVGLVLLAALITALLLIFFLQRREALTLRYDFTHRIGDLFRGLPKAWYPAVGYLFSPTRGVFWFSPVLLLAFGSPLVLPRSRWRESWLFLALMLAFMLGYGAIRGELWHGGAGWGARYMVPLTPFLMLAALPVLDRMVNHRYAWPKIALGVLAALGFAFQIGGLYVNLYDYYSVLQTATGKHPWHDSIIWNVRWSQVIGTLLYLPDARPDNLWLFDKPDWVVVGALLAGIALIAVLVVWLVRSSSSASPVLRWGVSLTPVLATGLTLFSLARGYDDPRYEGHNEALHAMRQNLEENAGPEDAILLSSPSYVNFFMNYYKGKPIWYGLPLSPGERYSLEQEPEVISDNVDDLVSPVAKSIFQEATKGEAPIWLVVDNGSFLPWATRPLEWYAAENSYIISTEEYSLNVRLVESIPATAPWFEMVPSHPVNAQFGDTIYLIGYDLADSDIYSENEDFSPGDLLGISLVFQSTGRMNIDYTMAVYLIDSAGQVALQQDSQPVGSFEPTSQWELGDILRDNHGFALPEDLPPGEYQVWVVVYDLMTLERLPVTGPDGSDWGDYVVLTTLLIE